MAKSPLSPLTVATRCSINVDGQSVLLQYRITCYKCKTMFSVFHLGTLFLQFCKLKDTDLCRSMLLEAEQLQSFIRLLMLANYCGKFGRVLSIPSNRGWVGRDYGAFILACCYLSLVRTEFCNAWLPLSAKCDGKTGDDDYFKRI